MDPDVNEFYASVISWGEVAQRLRRILLECELDEALKWRKPCYTFDGNNICIVQHMNDFLALMFFKGALLEDPDELLQEQGENTRSARRLCFTSVDEVDGMEGAVKDFVRQAIEVERKGLTVPKDDELVLVEELQDRLEADPALKAAFEALTPGRQRGYNIYFSGAKQSKTRAARVEKYVSKILAGKGMRDD